MRTIGDNLIGGLASARKPLPRGGSAANIGNLGGSASIVSSRSLAPVY